ncbi:uncharacterized protein [Haliaeetus albicilla]|uniref:uncharacterized protein n=1 Tax=Haliaeetus albicilla TaxID=8969 RepID=UPI0037E7A117
MRPGGAGKPTQNHTKPLTLLRLTWSDSGGRGGSRDYAAPESHAAARPPSPRKLQLPACPGRQPALLPDPEGTPLPFPPTPTPAQPQFPPSPQRRSRQLRRAPAAAPCVRHGTPPSSSGLSPEPAGRLRSPATGPVLRLGHCQVSSFPFTQVHQRGHKGDFFQREDRVIKSKVHDLPFSFMKRWSRLSVALTRILELHSPQCANKHPNGDGFEYLQQLEPSRNGGGRGTARPPQRLTSSSPGLPHGPSPHAKGAQKQPGGQRGQAASVYSVSRVPIESCQRVCSGSQGAPQRSLCPSDISDSIFPYILYGTSKYWDGFKILYQLWKLVCC